MNNLTIEPGPDIPERRATLALAFLEAGEIDFAKRLIDPITAPLIILGKGSTPGDASKVEQILKNADHSKYIIVTGGEKA
jgi:hypothetical protein